MADLPSTKLSKQEAIIQFPTIVFRFLLALLASMFCLSFVSDVEH